MIAVAVPFRTGEARHQHVGAEGANHAHDVGQGGIVAAPLLKCFRGRF